MRITQTLSLAVIGLAALTGSALATPIVPGPIAGVGLSAVAIIGGAYWLGRRLFKK